MSQWLTEIDPGPMLSPASHARVWVQSTADPRLFDIAFPHSIISLVARARAVFEGHEPGPARIRRPIDLLDDWYSALPGSKTLPCHDSWFASPG